LKIHKAKDYKINVDTIVTIGTFDGVHVGHQEILKRLVSGARQKGLESVVLTFFPHPRMVLQKDAQIKLLNTLDEKAQLLEDLEIDHLVIQEFTEEFSRQTAIEYVRDLLVNKLKAKHIIIGYDHRFGRNRTANIDTLIDFGDTYDFVVEEITAQEIDEVTVSSTKIRNALLQGNVSLANEFLGYHFMINATIIKGKGLGKQLNFPTANLKIDQDYKLIPSNGVYAVKVVLNEEEYYGMMNIGTNPTVSNSFNQHIEVNIFNFDDEVYDQLVTIKFLDRIRSEIKFESINELQEQLQRDKEYVLTYLAKNEYK